MRTGRTAKPSSDPRRALTSVIITTYNQAAYLGCAIESVLAQTVTNREILVVDDGSTDDAYDVARQYDGVTYVRQDNLGLSAARNRGICESRGDYVVFLDADDRLLPNALAAGLRCFGAGPGAAFVSGRYQLVSHDARPLAEPSRMRAQPADYEAFLRGNCIGMHGTVMYRRSVLLQIGGFDTGLPACEDYDLYLRIARLLPIAHHDEVVAEYRIHTENMSRDTGLMLSAALRVSERQRPFAANNPRRLQALLQGQRRWRRYYADKTVAVLRSTRGKGPDGRRALKSARAMARLAPGHFVLCVAGAAGRSFRRSLAAGRTRLQRRRAPRAGEMRFGDFRRLTPVSRRYGFDRGRPIDRHYIEAFLGRNAGTVRGRVLEIGDNAYTLRFGGSSVTTSDVLHVEGGNPTATFVGDLATGAGLPDAAFDCVILTQTLHLIFDVRSALETLQRILKPGGVLLLTVPGTISQVEDGQWSDVWYWGFTERSIGKLCSEVFEESEIEIDAHGSVLTSVAFLHGLSAGELNPEELAFRDPLYPLLITVRIRKSERTSWETPGTVEEKGRRIRLSTSPEVAHT